MALLFSDDNNYEPGSETNSFAVTSVPAVAGNFMLVVLNHNNAGGDKTFSSPTWNGETIPELYEPYIAFTDPPSGNNDPFNKTSFFGVFVTTSTTATVSAALDGFADGHISVSVWSDIDTGTPTSTLSAQQVWSPWSNPSLDVGSVASSDVVLSFLAASLWDNGYSAHPATTWNLGGGQTSFLNSSIGSNRVGRLIGSTKTGTGTVTVGYTPSADQPVFAHFAFALKGAASSSIDSVTTDGNPGLVVGEPFAITTTGLTDLVQVTIQTTGVLGATVPAGSLSAPGGDGTAVMPYWVDAQKFPFIGTASVEATDTIGLPIRDFPLAAPPGFLEVEFEDVETTDDTYIGTKLDEIGRPLEDGDLGYYPAGNGLAIGPNGHISCLGAMSFVLWIQKLNSTMYQYNVTVNDAGEVTDVTGISTRGVSSRHISSRGITKRGLS
jgi:hypothetical protein